MGRNWHVFWEKQSSLTDIPNYFRGKILVFFGKSQRLKRDDQKEKGQKTTNDRNWKMSTNFRRKILFYFNWAGTVEINFRVEKEQFRKLLNGKKWFYQGLLH